MNERVPPIMRAALSLGVVALLALTLLTGVFALTRGPIAENEILAQRQALANVLASDRYDNDLSNDRIYLIAPAWLGSGQPMQVFRARHHGQHSALVLEAVAPESDAGPVHLLIAIDADGRVRGVRVTEHHETAGPGEAIEVLNSAWGHAVSGKAQGALDVDPWNVKREGGLFNPSAIATVAPPAVINAVRCVLQLAARHGDSLYDASAGTTLIFKDGPKAASPR